MKLTLYERLVLVNQFLILEKLYPDQAREYAPVRKAFEEGYELQYSEATKYMGRGVAKETCQQISDILQMHRALHDAVDKLKPKGLTLEMVQFDGFDGNGENEGEALSYTRYLTNDLGLFKELVRPQSDFNSHSPMFHRYERMLIAYRTSKDPYRLTEDDVRRVLDAAKGH